MVPDQSNRTFKTPGPARASRGGSLYFPCPLTGNRTLLCFSLCRPIDGMGDCGREAGHARLGRTQLAILEHERRSTGA
jgi:hypothetical protein